MTNLTKKISEQTKVMFKKSKFNQNRILIATFILYTLFLPLNLLAQDDWKEYSSGDFNISFALPSSWDVDIQENEVIGISDKNFIGFYLFRPSANLPNDKWNSEIQKQIAFSQFQFNSENQSMQHNNLNMLASEGTGYGLEYDTQLYFYIISIVRDENPLVAFTFCSMEDLPRNEKTMKEILLSFTEIPKN